MSNLKPELPQYLKDLENLGRAFRSLNSRERKIISLRFGFIDGKTYTLEEAGKEFNISRERARQIESKILEKLRLAYSVFEIEKEKGIIIHTYESQKKS